MSDFLARLKHRKLVQLALAHVAFAFMSIHVADVVARSYHWPDGVAHLLSGMLVPGFIVICRSPGITLSAHPRRARMPAVPALLGRAMKSEDVANALPGDPSVTPDRHPPRLAGLSCTHGRPLPREQLPRAATLPTGNLS